MTEKISGSRSMKTGFGSSVERFDRAAKRESGPPACIVDKVVSKNLPPTLSLMRSSVQGTRAGWEFPLSMLMEKRRPREVEDVFTVFNFTGTWKLRQAGDGETDDSLTLILTQLPFFLHEISQCLPAFVVPCKLNIKPFLVISFFRVWVLDFRVSF